LKDTNKQNRKPDLVSDIVKSEENTGIKSKTATTKKPDKKID
jgi:hypothetical protein